jgi:hypothetical protein
VPPTVFVSYSHRDETWKDRLVKHLEVLEFEGTLDVWDDRRLVAGDEWRPDIEAAIERAAVAVLIVSPDFLTSRFIREKELTRILERRSQQQLRVIPLIARPCAWQAVQALQGIQARPRNARPLSAGDDHRIDADLADLALEIRQLVSEGPPLEGHGLPQPSGALTPRAIRVPVWLTARSVAWLCLPSALAGLLALVATVVQVPTRVSVDLVTRRVSFKVRGQGRPILLNANRGFSELAVERCGTVSFQADEFRPIPTTVEASGDAPSYSGRVQLACLDPDAKITLAGSAEQPKAVGTLDRLALEEGATVVIDVASSARPVFTLDLSASQAFDLAIHEPLSLTADLAQVEKPTGGAQPLAKYEVRVPQSNRFLRVDTNGGGTVLVVTPTPEHAAQFFNSPLLIPAEDIQFQDEALNEGALISPLVREGTLAYPDFPSKPPKRVAETKFFVAARTSDMVITRIALLADAPGLAVKMEGTLEQGRVGTPAPPGMKREASWDDASLTLYDQVRYGPVWRIVAGIALWALTTAGIGYEYWKKLVV